MTRLGSVAKSLSVNIPYSKARALWRPFSLSSPIHSLWFIRSLILSRRRILLFDYLNIIRVAENSMSTDAVGSLGGICGRASVVVVATCPASSRTGFA